MDKPSDEFIIMNPKKGADIAKQSHTPLLPWGPEIWVKTSPLSFYGVPFMSRMTVVRLPDNILWVHSPIKLDEKTQAELDQLGEVAYVISPNKFHHLYMRDYMTAYPECRLFASPGLEEKCTKLTFDTTLGAQAEAEWEGRLKQTLFASYRHREEIVFCHEASQTLIVADLIENFHEESALPVRLITRLVGMYKKPVPPKDNQLFADNHDEAREAVEEILSWDFDKIILAHGRLVLENGKDIIKRGFDWLNQDK